MQMSYLNQVPPSPTNGSKHVKIPQINLNIDRKSSQTAYWSAITHPPRRIFSHFDVDHRMLRLGSTEGAAYLPDEAKAFVSALLFKRRAKRREREEEGGWGVN